MILIHESTGTFSTPFMVVTTDTKQDEDWERLKKLVEAGKKFVWRPAGESFPQTGGFVLVTVNGVYRDTCFANAVSLAMYAPDCGWILEEYPEWESPEVTAWMPLPEPYREENDEINRRR